MKLISLNDEEQVKEQLNATLDEVWQEFGVIAQLPPYALMRCVTVKMPLQYPTNGVTVSFISLLNIGLKWFL